MNCKLHFICLISKSNWHRSSALYRCCISDLEQSVLTGFKYTPFLPLSYVSSAQSCPGLLVCHVSVIPTPNNYWQSESETRGKLSRNFDWNLPLQRGALLIVVSVYISCVFISHNLENLVRRGWISICSMTLSIQA